MPHVETTARVAAPPAALFDQLDDQTRLGEHMEKPSMMMGGGRMAYAFDAGGGMAVGSHIRMDGEAFGLSFRVEEVVTEHDPPNRKTWRTIGTPRLLIVASYEMGFDIRPTPGGADLRVWIDYELPGGVIVRLLAALPAWIYARWCVGRMALDAARRSVQPLTAPAA